MKRQIKIRLRSTEDNIAMLILALFLFVNFLKNLLLISFTIMGGVMAMLGNVALIYALARRRMKTQFYYFLTLVVLTVCLLSTIIVTSNSGLEELLWATCFMGIAMLFIEFNIDSNVVAVYFYVIATYFFAHILIGHNPNQVLVHTSQNGVSGHVLFAVILYYVVLYINNEKITIFPAALSFVLCIWGEGRGGIVSSILLLLLFVCFRIKNSTMKLRNPIIIGILIAVVISGIIVLLNASNSPFEYFMRQGLRSGRYDIWKEYIDKISSDFSALIFGPKISEMRWARRYSGNLHNSLFMLHLKYGLLGFAFMLFFLVRGFKKLIQEKYWFLVWILLVAFFRSMLDATSFPGVYDVFWFFLILITIPDIRLERYQNETT